MVTLGIYFAGHSKFYPISAQHWGHLAPQELCIAVFGNLQFNTLPSAFIKIVVKTTSPVVKSQLGELSTKSFKATHKNVVLHNFILFPFLP